MRTYEVMLSHCVEANNSAEAVQTFLKAITEEGVRHVLVVGKPAVAGSPYRTWDTVEESYTCFCGELQYVAREPEKENAGGNHASLHEVQGESEASSDTPAGTEEG